jgi:hypothetical protein
MSFAELWRDVCLSAGQAWQVLNEHLHYVQGVAWDPAGQFVVSLSADRTCRIYSSQMIPTSKGTDKGFYVCQQVLAKTDLAPLKQNDKTDLNGSIVKVSQRPALPPCPWFHLKVDLPLDHWQPNPLFDWSRLGHQSTTYSMMRPCHPFSGGLHGLLMLLSWLFLQVWLPCSHIEVLDAATFCLIRRCIHGN